VGLAVAVVLMLAAVGGGIWVARERRQATDVAALRLLAEAQALLGQAWADPVGSFGEFQQARGTAAKAEQLAREGSASEEVRQRAVSLVQELTRQAEASQRDRLLLAALLAVRAPHEGPRYRQDGQAFLTVMAEPTAEEQFRAAFRAWDATFDIDLLPTEALAARLKERPPAVVMEVIAALDEWANERRRQRRPACHGNPWPAWRQRWTMTRARGAASCAPSGRATTYHGSAPWARWRWPCGRSRCRSTRGWGKTGLTYAGWWRRPTWRASRC
jgi:hypothetical protein